MSAKKSSKDPVGKRDQLFKSLVDLQKKIDKCKPLFDLRDNLYAQIASIGLGEFYYNDLQFVVKDNFENKNKAYKVAGVNRFEVSFKQIKK